MTITANEVILPTWASFSGSMFSAVSSGVWTTSSLPAQEIVAEGASRLGAGQRNERSIPWAHEGHTPVRHKEASRSGLVSPGWPTLGGLFVLG